MVAALGSGIMLVSLIWQRRHSSTRSARGRSRTAAAAHEEPLGPQPLPAQEEPGGSSDVDSDVAMSSRPTRQGTRRRVGHATQRARSEVAALRAALDQRHQTALSSNGTATQRLVALRGRVKARELREAGEAAAATAP